MEKCSLGARISPKVKGSRVILAQAAKLKDINDSVKNFYYKM